MSGEKTSPSGRGPRAVAPGEGYVFELACDAPSPARPSRPLPEGEVDRAVSRAEAMKTPLPAR